LAWAYVTTLGLTITNPATIVSFIALAAALGLGTGGSFERPAAVVAGVLFGSATWWCLLAIAASILRERVTPRVVGAISLVSGLAIAALGMAALDSVFI
jgi:arginine exporter protein ArgO